VKSVAEIAHLSGAASHDNGAEKRLSKVNIALVNAVSDHLMNARVL